MKRYIITCSYGDVSMGNGGTDKAVISQIGLLNKYHYEVLSLSPYKRNYWNVLNNGNFLGIFSTKRFLSYISSLKDASFNSFIIHHLKNINMNNLNIILDFLQIPIIIYLHDYYSVCPTHGLIRENGKFCGNSFPNIDKCNNCVFFNNSLKLLNEYKVLFKKYKNNLIFISPSDSIRNNWIKDYPNYANQTYVIYHQNLVGSYDGNNDVILREEKIKVAFVGYQQPLKGWNEFKEAAIVAMNKSNDFIFYQFGWGKDKIDGIEQVSIDFKKNINGMIDELRKKKIHIAILWSLWPETYSYTYYESSAANCFIITNAESGNIAYQVQRRNNGIIVNNLKEILETNGNLKNIVNEYRASNKIVPLNLELNEEIIYFLPTKDARIKYKNKNVDISIFLTIFTKIKKSLRKLK